VKGEALVTNVEGTVLEKAGTLQGLLDKIPNVSAEEGTVSVFGRGEAEIYINGRKMRDASELDQIAADNIKQVEVISHPGAQYDASVKAVVRITTKRTQGEGFGFSNRLASAFDGDHVSPSDQLNLNYRRGGLDLAGMLSYGIQHWVNRNELFITSHLDKLWTQDLYNRTKMRNENLQTPSPPTTSSILVRPWVCATISVVRPVNMNTADTRPRYGRMDCSKKKRIPICRNTGILINTVSTLTTTDR
jgi:hypothetical protein